MVEQFDNSRVSLLLHRSRTGSNSVNVFLGLGLPWLISSIHAILRGAQYCVATTGVFEGTILFLPSAILVLSLLVFRRKVSFYLLSPLCHKFRDTKMP